MTNVRAPLEGLGPTTTRRLQTLRASRAAHVLEAILPLAPSLALLQRGPA